MNGRTLAFLAAGLGAAALLFGRPRKAAAALTSPASPPVPSGVPQPTSPTSPEPAAKAPLPKGEWYAGTSDGQVEVSGDGAGSGAMTTLAAGAFLPEVVGVAWTSTGPMGGTLTVQGTPLAWSWLGHDGTSLRVAGWTYTRFSGAPQPF